ncbi:15905_t:CDS:2, partial [Gigaspora margarita]
LSWKDPLASKVVSDESDLVKTLEWVPKQSFIRPKYRMQAQTPSNIQICVLVNITEEILDSLGDIWQNPAFDAELAKGQSETVDGKQDKCPDIILIKKHYKKLYELLFIECFCLIRNESKKEEDKVKLWQEMNDGMYYVHKSC